MQPIIIAGNSASTGILHEFIKHDGRYKVLALAADKEYINEAKLFNLDVLDINMLNEKFDMNKCKVILGIGYNGLNMIREKMFHKIKKLGFAVETYVHRDAKIYSSHPIGEGSIIMPNTVIEPFAKVGKNTVIWSNCVVAHHSTIGNSCWLAAGTVLAGNVEIKDNCFLGVGAIVSYKVMIEKFNVIGAGTTICKNTSTNEVYLTRNGEKHRFDGKNYASYFLK